MNENIFSKIIILIIILCCLFSICCENQWMIGILPDRKVIEEETTTAQATPVVTALPSGIEANKGQQLSEISLTGKGSANVPGQFVWTTPTDLVGEIGDQLHSVNFIPTDTVNYKSLIPAGTVTVVVKGKVPTPNITLEQIMDETLPLNITDYDSESNSITIERDDIPYTLELQVDNPSQYEQIEWILNPGNITATGSSYTFSIEDFDYTETDTYSVLLMVWKEIDTGVYVPYSRTIWFKVEG